MKLIIFKVTDRLQLTGGLAQAGLTSRTLLWDFGSLSPVRAFVNPRPNAEPPPR